MTPPTRLIEGHAAKTFMIERRYGPCNRDWLQDYAPPETVWTGSPRRALIFESAETAATVRDKIEALAAADWPNPSFFAFAVIEDRRGLPSYFASQTVFDTQGVSHA